MSLQDLGAIGEIVGGIGVVVTLVYVAYQIRQSSRQIEQNSRHLEASMYYATNDAFFRWFALLAQDEALAALWRRVLRGDALERDEQLRVQAFVTMLFLSYENNFQQMRLGAVQRNTFELTREDLSRLLSRPVIRSWWEREGRRALTPEFREAVESLVSDGMPQAAPARVDDAGGPHATPGADEGSEPGIAASDPAPAVGRAEGPAAR